MNYKIDFAQMMEKLILTKYNFTKTTNTKLNIEHINIIWFLTLKRLESRDNGLPMKAVIMNLLILFRYHI